MKHRSTSQGDPVTRVDKGRVRSTKIVVMAAIWVGCTCLAGQVVAKSATGAGTANLSTQLPKGIYWGPLGSLSWEVNMDAGTVTRCYESYGGKYIRGPVALKIGLTAGSYPYTLTILPNTAGLHAGSYFKVTILEGKQMDGTYHVLGESYILPVHFKAVSAETPICP